MNSQSPTSHAVDESVYDVSYDSDTEIQFTSTSHSLCTSCDVLKKRIKGLQKTISWYKKSLQWTSLLVIDIKELQSG